MGLFICQNSYEKQRISMISLWVWICVIHDRWWVWICFRAKSHEYEFDLAWTPMNRNMETPKNFILILKIRYCYGSGSLSLVPRPLTNPPALPFKHVLKFLNLGGPWTIAIPKINCVSINGRYTVTWEGCIRNLYLTIPLYSF